MAKALRTLFLPNKVVLLNVGGQESSEIARLAPFIVNQPSIGCKATAYVCQNYSCSSPTTDVMRMLDYSIRDDRPGNRPSLVLTSVISAPYRPKQRGGEAASDRLRQKIELPLFLCYTTSVVKLTFYGGVMEIGGNKILLEDDKGKLFLDFGYPYSKYRRF